MPNIYRKNSGQFAPASDYDYVIGEEMKKAADMEKNKRAADIAAGKKITPIDVRGYNTKTWLPKTYKETTQTYYNKSIEYIKAHKTEIDQIDLNNEKEVVDVARKIINSPGVVCYGTAAGVAAILDARKVQYKIFAGRAEKELINYTQDQLSSSYSNHVWVETNKGKIYEWFNGDYSNKINHYTISDEIKLKRS